MNTKSIIRIAVLIGTIFLVGCGGGGGGGSSTVPPGGGGGSAPVAPGGGGGSAPVAPGPARDFVAMRMGRDVAFSWLPPINSGGAPITAYRIEYSTDDGANYQALVDMPAETTYTHRDLAPGANLRYRITPINLAGTGATIHLPDTVMIPAIPPGAVMNFMADVSGADAVDLSWLAPTNNGGAVVTYRIEVSEDGGGYRVLEGMYASTTYTHRDRAPGADLRYRITPFNSAGDGRDTPPLANAMVPPVTPGAVRDLIATRMDRDVALSWSPPSFDGGAPITAYRIEVSTDGSGNYQALVDMHVGTTYTHRDLAPGADLRYRITPINSVGSDMPAQVVTMIPAIPPGAVTNFMATNVVDRPHFINLRWTPPTNSGGAPVTYRIEVSVDDEPFDVLQTMFDGTLYSHVNRTPGSKLRYRITSINIAGVGDTQQIANAMIPPVAPGQARDFVAMRMGRDVAFSWLPPINSGGAPVTYRIFISVVGTGESEVLADVLDGTTYTHSDVPPGATLFYLIRAINSAGESSVSQPVVLMIPPVVPGAITDLTAIRRGMDVALSWTPPAEDGGAPITAYRIEYSTDDGANYQALVDMPAETTYTHRDLAPGANLRYRITPINSVGDGGQAILLESVMIPFVLPGAVTGFMADVSGTDAVDLSWVAPTNSGGAPVTYRIEYSTDGGANYQELEETHAGTSYRHSGLNPGADLRYRVTPVGGDAPTETSAMIPAIPPSAVSGFMADVSGTDAVNLRWVAPTNNGGAVVTYRIEYSTDDGANYQALVDMPTETTYTHRDLAPGANLRYRITPINLAGTGATIRLPDTVMIPAIRPSAVDGFMADVSGADTVDLSWLAPTNNGGAAVTYRIEASADGGANYVQLERMYAGTTFVHTGLPPGSNLRYRITPINIAGAGDTNHLPDTVMIPAIPPGAVTGFMADVSGTDAVALRWLAPINNGGAVVTYRIEYSTDGGANYQPLAGMHGGTTFQHRGLSPGSNLHYRITPINIAGAGAIFMPGAVTIPPIAPGAITNFMANLMDASVELSWSAPADSGGATVSYRIEVAEDGGGYRVLAAMHGGTSYTHSGFSGGINLRYRITAVNMAGNSIMTLLQDSIMVPPATRTCPGGAVVLLTQTCLPAPGAVSGLFANLIIGSNIIALRWNAPTGSGAALMYRIEVSVDGGPFTEVAVVSDTQYIHRGLASTTNLRYRITAVNAIGGVGAAIEVALSSGDIPHSLIPNVGTGTPDPFFTAACDPSTDMCYTDGSGGLLNIKEQPITLYEDGLVFGFRRIEGSRTHDPSFTVPNPPQDVRDAWRAGWTGQGTNILIMDVFGSKNVVFSDIGTHGYVVSMSAREIARRANIHIFEAGLNIEGGGTNRAYRDTYAPTEVPADTRIDVINMSFTLDPSERFPTLNEIRRFVARARVEGIFSDLTGGATGAGYLTNSGDAVIVRAAGNDPDAGASRYVDHRAYLEHAHTGPRTLFVGGLTHYARPSTEDENRNVSNTARIASYSSPAGVMADMQRRFLVEYGGTPFGENVFLCDAAQEPGCVNLQFLEDTSIAGTSFAAPRVSGFAALVRHKFPGLSGAQTAKILLDTANYEGLACNREPLGCEARIYGQGAVDIADALSPIGRLE